MKYFSSILLALLSFFYLNATPTSAEIIFAKRIHNYLVNEKSLKGAYSVGPALKKVIEGKAYYKIGKIPGNRYEVNLTFQKDEIGKHLREHRHFGNDKRILKVGEHFTKRPAYPSFFRIVGISSPDKAERISNALIDFLLSDSVSILIGDIENGNRANRFLLKACIEGHTIGELEAIPCSYNKDPRNVGQKLTSWVQLVVSAQTQFAGKDYAPDKQVIMITLFSDDKPMSIFRKHWVSTTVALAIPTILTGILLYKRFF